LKSFLNPAHSIIITNNNNNNWEKKAALSCRDTSSHSHSKLIYKEEKGAKRIALML
jgi:hypothetical protein